MSLLIVSAAVIVSSFLGYYSGRHLPPSSTSPAFIVNQPTHTLTPVPSLSPLPSPTPTPTIAPTLKPLPTITPTPLPIPTPTPTPLSTQADLYGLTEHYASQYHVDAGALRHIAECESGFNPSATHLDYAGLYQFSPDSWTKYRTQMGEDPHPDLRLSPDAATKTAAYILSLGHSSIWPTCAGSSL